MLGALMYASKMMMEVLPNIHLVGALTIAYTLVYRKKALYPIYLYVFLDGALCGFAAWWVPYLYIWAALWGAAMLLPKDMSKKAGAFACMVLCAAHGFLFGTLYAPAQAILYGLDFRGMVAWIVAGLPWDFLHGVSNFFCGALILPVAGVLRLAERDAKDL